MWVHWGSEEQEVLRYQVTYHSMYLAGGDCYTHQQLNLLLVELYMKLRFFVLIFFFLQINFVHYVMLTSEKIPGSPCFSVLQAMKGWAEPGMGMRLLNNLCVLPFTI